MPDSSSTPTATKTALMQRGARRGGLVKGKHLAAALGVTPASLSEAARRGWHCADYDVSAWVVRSRSGRAKGYRVPPEVLERLAQEGGAEAPPPSEEGAAASPPPSQGPQPSPAQGQPRRAGAPGLQDPALRRALRQTMEELRAAVGRLQSERSALRQELEALRRQMRRAEETEHTLRRQLRTARGELETTRAQLETAQGELATVEEELQTTRRELQRERQEVRRLKETLRSKERTRSSDGREEESSGVAPSHEASSQQEEEERSLQEARPSKEERSSEKEKSSLQRVDAIIAERRARRRQENLQGAGALLAAGLAGWGLKKLWEQQPPARQAQLVAAVEAWGERLQEAKKAAGENHSPGGSAGAVLEGRSRGEPGSSGALPRRSLLEGGPEGALGEQAGLLQEASPEEKIPWDEINWEELDLRSSAMSEAERLFLMKAVDWKGCDDLETLSQVFFGGTGLEGPEGPEDGAS